MCKRIDGVYLIKNNKTKRVRVGSAKDIPKRFSNYKATLRNGTANKVMQEDYNWYGEESFEFIILEECSLNDLFIREQHYLKLYEDCASYNHNRVVNTTKKVRTIEEAREYSKKRSKITSGENNGNCSKLDREDVIEIKLMLADGIKNCVIAEKFDVSEGYISSIKTGKRWSSVVIEEESIGVDSSIL